MYRFDSQESPGSRAGSNVEALPHVPHVYKPYRALPDVLSSILRALALRFPLLHGAGLHLRGVGTLTLTRTADLVRLAWLAASDGDEPHEACSSTPHHLPIRYAGVALGALSLSWADSVSTASSGFLAFESFARRCAYLVKRYEVQRWALERLGRSLLLVGNCEAIHQVEAFVERAADSGLPVLLQGEFGTEKTHIAAALHCCGHRRDGPFVEVVCAAPVGEPADWFRRAAGGTLFFNGIDELAPALQGQLPQFMHSRLGQWLHASGAADTRVVASTSVDLRRQVEEGLFARVLLAELDFLSVCLPPLRERGADIESLVIDALARHDPGIDHKFSDDLIAVCRAHSWPENLFELERSIARLAVMTDPQPIRRTDVLRHAPWLASAPWDTAEPEPSSQDDGHVHEHVPEQAAADEDVHAQRWVQPVLSRDLGMLGRVHDGVRKALLYIGERYPEPISLGQLAEQAHLSPSHLSYLFRNDLKTPFKPLLQRIRIEKAKELLACAHGRTRITEVALSVGFTDLSHFEKSFRRLTGKSPREYRRDRAI
jgi:AraC-like DNA-binding protein